MKWLEENDLTEEVALAVKESAKRLLERAIDLYEQCSYYKESETAGELAQAIDKIILITEEIGKDMKVINKYMGKIKPT